MLHRRFSVRLTTPPDRGHIDLVVFNASAS
jgi:hypothetical protein